MNSKKLQTSKYPLSSSPLSSNKQNILYPDAQEPFITSLEDLLFTSFQPQKNLQEKQYYKNRMVSNSTLGSSKCQSTTQLTQKSNKNIQKLEKRQVWPRKNISTKHRSDDKRIINYPPIIKTSSTHRLSVIGNSTQQIKLRKVCHNSFSQRGKKSNMQPNKDRSSKGYIPMLETVINQKPYCVHYSPVGQIPKKSSYTVSFEHSENNKLGQKRAQVGISTELTMSQINVMERQYNNKTKQRHSVTPQIEYVQQDKKVQPQVLNRKLQVLKEHPQWFILQKSTE